MAVTITAVPESLARAQFCDWLAQVGLDPRHVQSITIDHNGIKATVYALDGQGHEYANPGGDEVATHTVQIRLDDD